MISAAVDDEQPAWAHGILLLCWQWHTPVRGVSATAIVHTLVA